MGNLQTSDYSSVLKDYQRFQSDQYTSLKLDSSCGLNAHSTIQLEIGETPTGTVCASDVSFSNITAGASSTSNCKNLAKSSAEVTSTVRKSMIANVNQFIKQQNKNKSGWLALGFSAQIENASTVTELVNTITSKLLTQSSGVCNTTAESYAKTIVTLCGIYSHDNIDLDAKAISTAYMSCTVDLMVKSWQDDETLTKFAEAAFQGQGNISKGIFSGLGMLIIGAIVIVVLILLINDVAAPIVPCSY